MPFFQKIQPTPENVTIIVKTFQRPKTVAGAIAKIRQFYPTIPIFLADDSKNPLEIKDPNLRLYRLPFDTGISRGRNLMLADVETEYFVLMDDDHYFTRQTSLKTLVDIATTYEFDCLSCWVFNCPVYKRDFWRKRLANFYMNIELSNGIFRYIPKTHHRATDHIVCDLIPNFFLARTAKIKAMGGWEESLKVAEHSEFFLRAKQHGLKVGYTPLVSVDHKTLKSERFSANYADFRARIPEFRKIWIEKYNIREIIKRDGSSVSAEDYIVESNW